MEWCPERSDELLRTLQPPPREVKWVRDADVRGRVVQAALSANGGSLNGFRPRDLEDLYDRVTARATARRSVLALDPGDTCFCGDATCGCADAHVDQFDAHEVDELVRAELRAFSTPVQQGQRAALVQLTR